MIWWCICVFRIVHELLESALLDGWMNACKKWFTHRVSIVIDNVTCMKLAMILAWN